MLDVVDRRRQSTLKLCGNAAGHLIGGKAGILPNDGNHRNSNVWKDVDRRAQGRERANDEDDQREDDKGVGAPQRDADQCNHSGGALRFITSICLAWAAIHENGPRKALELDCQCSQNDYNRWLEFCRDQFPDGHWNFPGVATST